MTIKELSILFDVSDDTIRRAIQKALPHILKHGVETRLNSQQVKSIFGHLWVKGGTSLSDDYNSRRFAEVEHRQNVGLDSMNLRKSVEVPPQNAEVNPRDMIRLHRQALDMIEAMIPKVETYNAICESTNLKSVAQVAQIIGSGQKRLFQFMRDNEILNQYNRPYQQHIDAGRLVVKDTVRLINNNAMTFPQVFFTGKGEVWIAEVFGSIGNANRLLGG